MRWVAGPPVDSLLAASLCRELAIAPFLASLLCQRGFHDADLARDFLQPKLKSLSDPFDLPNMSAAIERILTGIDRRERIVLYGDYDVDGVTSLAMFTRVLRQFGSAPGTFLPQRMDEGYGLSPDGIARCLNTMQPQLLIALDCGTSSAEEVRSIKAAGVDVVVFDHHEIKAALPECIVVNPNLGDSFQYLCTAGLVFKACHALLKRRPLQGCELREYLDMVALGTVADIVPLVKENRILVQKGLRQMEQTRWPGIRALMDIAEVKTPIQPSDIGFRLGPRLNAAGRLGAAADALALLLTDDASEARSLATALDQQNRERQVVEQRTLKQAEKMVAATFVESRDATIVVGESGWHPGVLGIVASRIAKTFHRPTLVIGFDENGIGKGSGRSIEGFSLVQALAGCSDLIEKFGGHKMAAGLTIRRELFEEFRTAFQSSAKSQLSEDDLHPRLRLDGEISFAELNMDFLDHHDRMQPFGTGNPQPVHYSRGVQSVSEPRILKEKHILFELRQDGTRLPAIYFQGAGTELPAPPWDVAFRVERNEYRGKVSLQMQIAAIRTSQ